MAITYTDRDLLKKTQVGLASSAGLADAIGAVADQNTRSTYFTKAAADGMASTTTSEVFTGNVTVRKAKLKGIYLNLTGAGLTADNTNFATITVSKRDSAGANKTTLGTLTTTITSSGNLAQGGAKPFVLTAANVDLPALTTFTFEIAKSGSGVVVPAGVFTVDFEEY
jgi:hypothetical protein